MIATMCAKLGPAHYDINITIGVIIIKTSHHFIDDYENADNKRRYYMAGSASAQDEANSVF